MWLSGTGTADAATVPRLFRDPSTQVMKWVAANPGDPRAGIIRERIASQPQGHWFANYQPDSITSDVAGYVKAANAAGAVPLLIAYALPYRDCGGASAGGAPDIASYRTWIEKFAKGLGSRKAMVLLEPDSLALQTCLNSTQIADRDAALAFAGQTIKRANPAAKVYLDAGHSEWNQPDEQAKRLVAAGVKTGADGFFTNVSNFRPTADEVTYGKAVLAALGVPRLRFVVDTSRNGNGPLGSQWCDPAGRSIGRAPTLNTGDAAVDAYVWAKPPGEADGCAGTAGTFSPDVAFQLASGGAASPAPTGTPSPSAPSPSAPPTSVPPTQPPPPPAPSATAPSAVVPPATAPPATAPPTAPAGGCAVTYHVDKQWQNGFVATVTVTNGGSALTGWNLTFTFPDNQQITNAWNGRASASGQKVTVGDAGYNATVGAGATTSFGFLATYGGSNGAPRDFALNGTPCPAG
jgi:endoglucanase